MCKGLCATQASIGWADRPSRNKYGAVAFEHGERCALIREPAKCCERDESISPNHNETPKAMPNPWQAGFPASSTDSVL